MVIGVDTAVGRSAAQMLSGRGGEVRAFVQAASGEDPEGNRLAADLRSTGCKVAHGWLDDEAHVETALEQVHTVLHLLGRPTDDPQAYLDRTATVIGAAIGAGCRRLVLLSDLAVAVPGTPPDLKGNTWLAALGEAEDMAADAPLESVVLRCATIHGPDDPLTVAVAAGALGPDPDGAHWPVAARDVAATAVLADDQRDVASDLHVMVALAGPQRLTTARYARSLADLLPAAEGEDLPATARQLLLATLEPPADAIGRGGTALADAW